MAWSAGIEAEQKTGEQRDAERNEANGSVEANGSPEVELLRTEVGKCFGGELAEEDAEESASCGQK